MKHAYPYTIAIPHQRPATIWPGVDHDTHDLHSSILIESREDAEDMLFDVQSGCSSQHQAARIAGLLAEQLSL